MKKKTPRQKLTKELDDLCREYVKLRDNYTCQKCGKSGTKQIHWSHVIPRSAGNRLRWNKVNSKALCAYCHRRWWHSNPLDAMEWFKDTFPGRYEYLLVEKSKGSKKFSLDELEAIKEGFKHDVALLKKAGGITEKTIYDYPATEFDIDNLDEYEDLPF